MIRILQFCAVVCLATALAVVAGAQELRVPSSAIAGEEATIPTTGSGKATFYLAGPGVAQKSDVTLGEEIHIAAHDLQYAGDYTAILCSDECHSASFYVTAGKATNIIFLVHPSRVPVAQGDAVSGVAFPFDRYHNLVTAPLNVNFLLTAKDASLWSRGVPTHGGVAWFRTSSGKSAGPVQAVASLDDESVKRVVQQVASDPCNLRITGERTGAGILVQTEPVHDCAGNVVPDGTIVTFTSTGPDGKGTVDAPVKQGIARAKIESPGASTISVASGVVLGNEVKIGARP
ncbi:MAG: hypothetical protein WCC95_19300 [Candidatus Sulfotelmatobacter sp.]